MRLSVIALVLLSVLQVPAAAAEFPSVSGWTPDGTASSYGPNDLWNYINGAADQFLAYGFRGLRSCNLVAGDLTATVDIYDMGTALNAFGVFTTEMPDEAPALQIGGRSYLGLPYQALLLKDRYYVKVEAYEGDITQSNGTSLLTAVAAALPGSDQLPEELRSLPAKGRVTGSEGYSRQGYLGLSELRNCVHAQYDGPKGASYQVFRVLPDSGQSDAAMWSALASKWTASKHQGRPVLSREVPYRGLVGVVLTERGIFGVSEAGDRTQLLERLANL